MAATETLIRFVQIGDLHSSQNARQADRLRALDAIIAAHEHDEQLHGWLIPGDLHHSVSTREDRNALAPRLQRMAGVAPVFGCYGNHDAPGDLDIYTRLRAAHPIWFVSTPTVVRSGGFVTIAILPYPHKGELAARGIAPADMADVARDPLEAIFRSFGADLEAARERGDLPLFIGHVNIAGARMSCGQPNIGKEIELTPPLLELLGPCYKGVNHIHVAQDIAGASYPGSICRLDWGETDAKGYIVVECVRNSEAWSWLTRRVPLDVPPMYHVEGTLTRESFTYIVTKGPNGPVDETPASWKGCEVRCRYRFAKGEHSVLDKARVLAEFADALRLELEPIAVADTGLRAPQVAAARTLDEKAEAWASSTGASLSAGAKALLGPLQTTDRQTLLTDLATQLQAREEQPEAETVPA